MHDAVGNHGGETTVGIGQSLRVDALQTDDGRPAGFFRILPGDLRACSPKDRPRGLSPPALAGKVRAESARCRFPTSRISPAAGFNPAADRSVFHENPIHLAVVHRIVIEGLVEGVHGFGFENAGEHEIVSPYQRGKQTILLNSLHLIEL